MELTIGNKTITVEDKLISEALSSDGKITVDTDLIVQTKEEQDKYINNLKPSIVQTAMEIKVKQLRDEKGLELESGKKSFEGLFEAYSEKLKGEYTKEPNEQLQSKNKDIEILKRENARLSGEHESISSQFKDYKNGQLVSKTISKHIPENCAFDHDDMMLIINNKINPSVDDKGRVVFSKDGEVMKNPTTLDPLGVDKVMESFFSSNSSYLKGVSGGGAGSDSTGEHKKNSIEAFNEKYKTIGSIGTTQYNTALNEAVQSGEIEL